MKKIFYSFLFMIFFFSVQVTFADTIISFPVTVDPSNGWYKGKGSNKLQEVQIAEFNYVNLLQGDVTSASITGTVGGKGIWNIRKLDLYLGDQLLIDFDKYFKGLSKSDKKILRQGGMFTFNISVSEAELADLQDGLVDLTLYGRPNALKNLHFGETTLNIVDPVTPTPPEQVPEPATMLLLGSGLIGLWGFRRKFKK